MSNIEKMILRTVEETITRHRMIQAGDTVLAAVSGGPDSVALVYILLALASKLSFRVAVAHLNHCLRQNESARDEAFVAALGRQLKLPVHVEVQNVRNYQKRYHLSPEEAARQVRYRFYEDIAATYGYEKIALGHHSDDNAELVLMYLLRGSGPLGLSGIPPVRDAKIIRPLIDLKRAEIMKYLSANLLEYVVDSSNTDPKFLRNRIRDRLMPEIKANYNPKIIDSINRLAAVLSAEEEWMESLIQPIYLKMRIFEKSGRLGLDVTELNRVPIAAQRRLIRKAIFQVKGNLRRITFAHVEAVLKLVQKGPSSGRLDIPDHIGICRDRDVLNIFKEPRKKSPSVRDPAIKPEYAYSLEGPGEIFINEAAVKIRFSEFSLKPGFDWRHSGHRVAFFDMDKISFPLSIRNFCPGDRFSPLGTSGSQKLKKFFIDHKISRSERARCPIVLSRNKIIWVAGHRVDNSVKIGPQTRRLLKAELSLA